MEILTLKKKTEGDMSSDLIISSNSQPTDQLRRRSVSQAEEVKFRSPCFRTCCWYHFSFTSMKDKAILSEVWWMHCMKHGSLSSDLAPLNKDWTLLIEE